MRRGTLLCHPAIQNDSAGAYGLRSPYCLHRRVAIAAHSKKDGGAVVRHYSQYGIQTRNGDLPRLARAK